MAARYYGTVGYAVPTETAPGVWEDVITEYNYYGDVLRNSRKLENGEKVNDDISVGNSISILADPFAYAHFFAIRYLSWMGTLWTVSDVEVKSPRLILRIGVVYNGPKA